MYTLDRIDSAGGKLHGAVTGQLALKIIEADQRSEQIFFPPEADLSAQLGVSRTVVRESMKVLVDKGSGRNAAQGRDQVQIPRRLEVARF